MPTYIDPEMNEDGLYPWEVDALNDPGTDDEPPFVEMEEEQLPVYDDESDGAESDLMAIDGEDADDFNPVQDDGTEEPEPEVDDLPIPEDDSISLEDIYGV